MVSTFIGLVICAAKAVRAHVIISTWGHELCVMEVRLRAWVAVKDTAAISAMLKWGGAIPIICRICESRTCGDGRSLSTPMRMIWGGVTFPTVVRRGIRGRASVVLSLDVLGVVRRGGIHGSGGGYKFLILTP
jgi:hypothetical protein